MVRKLLCLSIVGALLLGGAVMAQAASPPLGPPAPRPPIKEIGVQSILTAMLKGQIEKVVAGVNEAAAKHPDVRAKVSFTIQGFAPRLSATQFTDRPNERFVNVPYIITYKVFNVRKKVGGSFVSLPVTRNISQSIAIQVFCNQWQTGKGNIKIVGKVDKPYLEANQGTTEQIVDFFFNGFLTNYIDGKVREMLPPAFNSVTNLPGQCNALGAFAGSPSDLGDDMVQFSYHPTINVAVTQTALGQVSVKLVSLKRLQARGADGQPLYKAVEAPALEVFANNQRFYAPLQSLQEGQQVTLNASPMVLTRPGDADSLVVTANIIQNVAIGTVPTDSAFVVFNKSTNFGNGTQTLKIKKTYSRPPAPPLTTKPTFVHIDAYELTYQVTVSQPLVAQPLTPTTPPTTQPGVIAPVKIAPSATRRQ